VTLQSRLRKAAVSEDKISNVAACFSAVYVKWVEAAGARVAVIPYDAPRSQIDELLSSVSAVLFTGGELVLDLDTPYMQQANYIFQTVKARDQSNPATRLILWGTCMGFQTLNILAAQDPAVLSRNAFDSENIAWPLDLTAAGRSSSRMFADASAAVMTTLTTLNSTMNFHHDGIDTSVFQGNEKLNKFYRLISTNVDRKGRGFVSTIEAFEAPIYGTQWHPERPQFEWILNEGLPHDPATVEANVWTAQFFISQARTSAQSFANATFEYESLIYQHDTVDPERSSNQFYQFGPGGAPIRLKGL